MYFFVAAAFFSTVRVDFAFVLSLRRLWLASAVFLAAIAAAFWLQRGVGTFITDGDRALSSSAALLVLEATIFALVLPLPPRWISMARSSRPGIGLLLLSDQRTVWVAGVASIATLYLFSARLGVRRVRQTASAIIAATFGALILLLASGVGGVARNLSAAYGSGVSGEGTFSWRLAGWMQLIDRQRTQPLTNLLLGNPAGTGFRRVLNGEVISVAAHSEYVTVGLTLGLVGFAVLVVALCRVLRRLARLARGQRRDLSLGCSRDADLARCTTRLFHDLLDRLFGWSPGRRRVGPGVFVVETGEGVGVGRFLWTGALGCSRSGPGASPGERENREHRRVERSRRTWPSPGPRSIRRPVASCGPPSPPGSASSCSSPIRRR